MLSIDPKEVKTSVLHSYLLSAVAPRPIAFASTIDEKGNPNLSPFSFFNVFSAKPPIAVFSPARRGRDNTTKHTYENLKQIPEVVINVVTYNMVQQASLASTEYPKGVNEFEKAGFTQIASDLIRPFRVKESPVQMECKVKEIIELGQEGGAGNLVICEILKLHISEDIINANGQIDPDKIDLVARMGGDLYCRASGNSIFEVKKPLTTLGIGIDQIPESIRHSKVLSGNHLGILGNVEHLPSQKEVQAYYKSGAIAEAFQDYGKEGEKIETHLHHIAGRLLDEGKVQEAWKVLLSGNFKF
jgi:flavin reductase (DIM6/NTAB) family NADH-FMN oxidoreductase RutF